MNNTSQVLQGRIDSNNNSIKGIKERQENNQKNENKRSERKYQSRMVVEVEEKQKG